MGSLGNNNDTNRYANREDKLKPAQRPAFFRGANRALRPIAPRPTPDSSFKKYENMLKPGHNQPRGRVRTYNPPKMYRPPQMDYNQLTAMNNLLYTFTNEKVNKGNKPQYITRLKQPAPIKANQIKKVINIPGFTQKVGQGALKRQEAPTQRTAVPPKIIKIDPKSFQQMKGIKILKIPKSAPNAVVKTTVVRRLNEKSPLV